MLKRLLIATLPFLCLSGGAQTRLEYFVHYSDNMVQDGLHVELAYTLPEAADSSEFYYNNEMWGETNLLRSINRFENKEKNYRFKIDSNDNRITVYHAHTKKVRFSYYIKQDHADHEFNGLFRPKMNNTYFHLLGQHLFCVPYESSEKHDGSLIDVRIHWLGFPEDYQLINSFGQSEREQRFKAKLWQQLFHSVFVGGDYKTKTIKIENRPVYFAHRGEWIRYDETDMEQSLEKAIRTQRDFWKDYDFPYYSVILTPSITVRDSSLKGHSLSGTKVHNSFLVLASNTPFNTIEQLRYVFNHELMHDWIGHKISTRHEELNYWFSEGFTDYYTYKNRLRNGDFTPEKWLQSFNEDILKEYNKNPHRNIPNYVIKDKFWESVPYSKVPYRRGAIFAFWVDNQISLASKGKHNLDDLMRELFVRTQKNRQRLADELFIDLCMEFIRDDISQFFQKHILVGEDFDYTHWELAHGFSVEMLDSIPCIRWEAKPEQVAGYLGNRP